ncbi:MAG: polysaccharide deacetylase family protein [Rhodothermales bacterium]|nr:polysaccharide deacetylase family protein [Rhodothermales bacterium]MBO6781071.1 polysaccharide deacetylase family protein [Rhodothermales bacterium]
MRRVTIIMYHYVRELEHSRYPGIKGRSIDTFRFQLDHIARHFSPVSMAQVVHAARTGDDLPPNAALLTFDDGYIDHYTVAFPMLAERGMPAAFFPPVGPAVRRELLDVNRVHFVLASADVQTLGREVDEAVDAHRDEYDLQKPSEYRSKWAKTFVFDDPETIYVKRMLQVALPEELRGRIARDLFARHVGVSEEAFARELYCSVDQLRHMQKNGMYVGSHGDSHYWLNSVDEETQRREIEGSLAFLREIGSPVDDFWVMCYPYGGWNEGLLGVLEQFDCALGLLALADEGEAADLDRHHRYLLPRFDTNQIPFE